MADAIADFFGAWGLSDAAARQDKIGGAMATAFTYADPRSGGRLTELSALCDYVGQFSANAPGWTASVAASDSHDGFTRAIVAFGGKGPDGSEMVQHGTYFAELDASGRIASLVGFVGTGAPA